MVREEIINLKVIITLKSICLPLVQPQIPTHTNLVISLKIFFRLNLRCILSFWIKSMGRNEYYPKYLIFIRLLTFAALTNF